MNFRYDKKLWFVVLKQENRGYSWYLVSSDKISAGEVVTQCLTGYGHRWKIEEYHRHIKTEFHLEKIQIRKFEGLQTMLSVPRDYSCHGYIIFADQIST